MDLHTLISLLATTILITAADSQNETEATIPEDCLQCLRRVAPDPDKECIPHFSLPDTLQCGSFKLTKVFHIDCFDGRPDIPEEWMDWRECTRSDECSAQCVRFYYERYTPFCESFTQRPLTCADYGHMHSTGINSCGKEYSETATSFLLNMTLLCGCQTVYGSREQCLQTTTVSTNDGSQLGEYEVIVIVVCVCLSVLVLAVLVSVMYWCIHRRKAGNQGSLKSKRSYKQAAPVERVPTFHPLEKAQTKNEFDSEYVDFAEEVDIKPEPAPRANQSPVVVHNHYVNQ